jgi:hypothetical protein
LQWLDRDEDPFVDTQDPVCATNVDPATEEPFESGDFYYDYISYGCAVFLSPSVYDPDGQTGSARRRRSVTSTCACRPSSSARP